MKVIAKTLSVVATGFTVLVLLAAVVFMGPKLIGLNPYIVESGSMEPLIPTGGIAYINTKDTDAEVEDVVTYRIEGLDTEKLVTHRIVREEDGKFIMQGDANDSEDQNPVSKDQIVGTYSYSIPKLGFIFAKQDKLIPLIALWVVGLNVLAMVARAIANKTENDEEEANENT